MIKSNQPIVVSVPQPRTEIPSLAGDAQPDQRPRFLRWLLPTACSSAVPLTGMQQAQLKLIAYH